LPVYSKTPTIKSYAPPGVEDIMLVTHFIPESKELPPEEPKPKTKPITVIPVTFEPVVNNEPVPDPIVEQAEPLVSAKTTQVLITPKAKKKKIDEYTSVEIMPSFIGGEHELFTYIANKVYYSPIAIDLGLEGKVYVRFVIDPDGKIKNVEIAKGIDPLLDNAALKVVKNMPAWNAGSQNGENVNVSMVLPINFVLK